MTIKPDGSCQVTSVRGGGTLTVGLYYLEGGKLKCPLGANSGAPDDADPRVRDACAKQVPVPSWRGT